ncbi:hypothetical protein TK5_19010 [Sideroxyarcus sp. TK5]
MKITSLRKFLLLPTALIVMAIFCTPALAAKKSMVADDDMSSLLEMSDQFDQVDKEDFKTAIDRANDCTHARDFACSEKELAKAAKAARSGHDKKILAVARQKVTDEKAHIAEEARQREYEAEKERRRAEAEAENEVSSAAMFAGVLNALNAAEARDQQLRSGYAEAMARASAAGEAERRRRENAEAKRGADRRQREVAARNDTYRQQSAAVNQGSYLTTQNQSELGSSHNGASGGGAQTSAPGVYKPTPHEPRSRDCTLVPSKEMTFSMADRDKSKAQITARNDAKFACIARGGYKLINENCESKALHKSEVTNGKLAIIEDGIEWACRVTVICNKPEERCAAITSGASEQ